LADYLEFRSFKRPARPAGQLNHSGPLFNCWQFAGVSGVSLQQELQQPVQEDDCQRNFGWNQQ